MKVYVEIDRIQAIRAANDKFGYVLVEVDLKKLSQSQREELTYCPTNEKNEIPILTSNVFAMGINQRLTMPNEVFSSMPVLGPLPDQEKICEILDARTKMRKKMGKIYDRWEKALKKYEEAVVTAFLANIELPEEPKRHEHCGSNCYCEYVEKKRLPLTKKNVEQYYHSPHSDYLFNDPTYDSYHERQETPYIKIIGRYAIDEETGIKKPYDQFFVELPLSLPYDDARVKKHVRLLEQQAEALTTKSKKNAMELLTKAINEKKAKEAEISLWINTHGSEHLKRVHSEGYPFHGAYIEERCRHELELTLQHYVIIDPSRNIKEGERLMPSNEILDIADKIRQKGFKTKVVYIYDASYYDQDNKHPISGEAVSVTGYIGTNKLYVGFKPRLQRI